MSYLIPKSLIHSKRQITLVTVFLSMADDEDGLGMFEVWNGLMPAFTRIAQSYEGMIQKDHNTLQIMFGVVATQEYEIDFAVKAAIHFFDFLQEQKHNFYPSLVTKIAICQGEAWLGATNVRGEVIKNGNVLVERTDAGIILATFPIFQATQHLYHFTGVDTNYQLLQKRETPLPARGLHQIQTKLVGRNSQLDQMLSLVQGLDGGLGGIIIIEGEAGIGKSRLVQELLGHLRKNEWHIWQGTCHAQQSEQAFSLIINILDQVFNIKKVTSPTEIRQQLLDIIARWGAGLSAIVPYLELLMGISPSGTQGERLLNLTPEQLRQQIFVAFRRLLKTISKEKPLVLFLDDLHWVDPVSAELLLFIATTVASSPILLVCAQRRDNGDGTTERIKGVQSLLPGQTVSLLLERLSFADCQALLAELTQGAQLTPQFITEIFNRSEGNPYFIEEYVRLLIDLSVLEKTGEKWTLKGGGKMPALPLPDSLNTLLRTRFDQLPLELKQVAQAGAVVSQPFSLELISKIISLPNIPFLLDQLENHLILHRNPHSKNWVFYHSLFNKVVYDNIPNKQKRHLHAQTAQAIESYENNHVVAELAYHWMQAQEIERALPYYVEAGEHAAAQFANEAAIAHFKQAILASAKLNNKSFFWRITIGLGDVYRFVGQYNQSQKILLSAIDSEQHHHYSKEELAGLYRRLGETCQKMGQQNDAEKYLLIAENYIESPYSSSKKRELASIYLKLGWVYFLVGEFSKAENICRKGIVLAQESSAFSVLAECENLFGGILYRQGIHATALEHTRRSLEIREQIGDMWGVASTLNNLAILTVDGGQWQKGIHYYRRSLQLRRDMGDAEGEALILNNLGVVYLYQGELEAARTVFSNSLRISKLFNIAFHYANAFVGLAQAFLWLGNIDKAQDTILEGILEAEKIGAQTILSEMYRVHGEILFAKGLPEPAENLAVKGAETAHNIGSWDYEGTGWRYAAVFALAQGKTDKAENYLTNAYAVIQMSATVLEQALFKYVSGMLAAQKNQYEIAYKLIEQASQTLEELGAALYTEQVKNAMDKLAAK